LDRGERSALIPRALPFAERLQELGYTEGRNLVVERRLAEGRIERLPELAVDLVRLDVDVILAVTTPAVQAARAATLTIPIVFVGVADPVGTGLVESLARPGGNVTGISTRLVDLVAKQLQLLKELVPSLSRVAVLSNPENAASALSLKEAECVSRSFGIEVIGVAIRSPSDVGAALASLVRDRPGALLIHSTAPMIERRVQILEFATSHRLPAVTAFRQMADAGALATYGPDARDGARRAADYVVKIFKGAKPGNLPVEQPTKLELVINLKTAKALGLTIPQSLLLRADQVIE